MSEFIDNLITRFNAGEYGFVAGCAQGKALENVSDFQKIRLWEIAIKAYLRSGNFARAGEAVSEISKFHSPRHDIPGLLNCVALEFADHAKKLFVLSFAIDLADDDHVIFHNIIVALLELGNYDGARELLSDRIIKYPTVFYNYFDMGCIFSYKKDFDIALNFYDKSIKLNDNFERSFIDRAFLRWTLGDIDGAISDHVSASRINSKNHQTHTYHGALLSIKNDGAAAIEKFNEALKISPRNVRALYFRACAYFKLGQYELSLQDANSALRIDNSYYPSHELKTKIYFKQKEFKKCFKKLGKLMQEHPNFLYLYNLRGLFYFKLNFYNSAINDLNIASKSEDKNVFANLGHVHAAIYDYNKASSYYSKSGDNFEKLLSNTNVANNHEYFKSLVSSPEEHVVLDIRDSQGNFVHGTGKPGGNYFKEADNIDSLDNDLIKGCPFGIGIACAYNFNFSLCIDMISNDIGEKAVFILNNFLKEAENNYRVGSYCSFVFMLGSFLEGLIHFLMICKSNEISVNDARDSVIKKSNGSKLMYQEEPVQTKEFRLSELIIVAKELGWVDESDPVAAFIDYIKDYRNLNHPILFMDGKKFSDKMPGRASAVLVWDLVKFMTSHIVANYLHKRTG